MSGTCNDGSSYSYAVGEVQSGEPLGGANGTSKFAFTYVFVEANAKMPCGDGFQSGFWLATAREGGIPELDIAEYWYNMTQWAITTARR
jgi:beta-glucanase (GH16 family)